MKKLMKIEGIHCGGCEGRADDVLKQTAEAANFKVLGIE